MATFEIIGKSPHRNYCHRSSIRDLIRLQKHYGVGRWRKMKGIATIKLHNGVTHIAELHWYEAHGIGKKEIKLKRYWINTWIKKEEYYRFAICIDNSEYPASLEKHKIYRILQMRRRLWRGFTGDR
jgi:hypothetical protein